LKFAKFKKEIKTLLLSKYRISVKIKITSVTKSGGESKRGVGD